MKSTTRAVAASVLALLILLTPTTSSAEPPTWEAAPTFHGVKKAGWFKNHYDARYRYTCATDKDSRQTWARWSWADIPVGYYRIEAFVPPYEATAIVNYRIGAEPGGPLMEPVGVIQAAHRGAWARVADFFHAGGGLWMELGDHGTEASGTRDWCAWGGDHSIGAANARLSPISEDEMDAPIDPADTNSDITLEGSNFDGTLTPFYQDLYAQYRAQSPYGWMCERRSTRHQPTTNNPWLVTRGTYAFYLGECTSWVQFRLRDTVAPEFDNAYGRGSHGGDLWDHAGNWDDNAKRLAQLGVTVTQEPKEHAVALWQPHKAGSRTSLGHVAFVEAVSEDGNVIWVSEMNRSDAILCYLSVRKIIKGSSGWPNTFIHFDEPPKPTFIPRLDFSNIKTP